MQNDLLHVKYVQLQKVIIMYVATIDQRSTYKRGHLDKQQHNS